jgi:alpha-L-fucosidase
MFFARASKNAGCYWPCSVRKSKMRWQEMEYYSFLRFSLNTYTDQSWGYGNEDINLLNPEKLDCRQWARICKAA